MSLCHIGCKTPYARSRFGGTVVDVLALTKRENARRLACVGQVQLASLGAVVVDGRSRAVVGTIDAKNPAGQARFVKVRPQVRGRFAALGHGQADAAVGFVVVDKRGVCIDAVVQRQTAKVQLAG